MECVNHPKVIAELMAKSDEATAKIISGILEEYNEASEAGHDRMRLALGSAVFREIENLASYNKQIDAHVEEWTQA